MCVCVCWCLGKKGEAHGRKKKEWGGGGGPKTTKTSPGHQTAHLCKSELKIHREDTFFLSSVPA